jgi:uncharacterized membrane protein (GlpM family)
VSRFILIFILQSDIIIDNKVKIGGLLEANMSFLEGFLRFVLGGTLVLIVSIVAKNGKTTIAGIIALFPIITAVSFYFMSKTVEVKTLKDAILTSLISFPTTLAFLASLFLCVNRFNIVLSLIISVFVWLIAAIIMYYIKTKLF